MSAFPFFRDAGEPFPAEQVQENGRVHFETWSELVN